MRASWLVNYVSSAPVSGWKGLRNLELGADTTVLNATGTIWVVMITFVVYIWLGNYGGNYLSFLANSTVSAARSHYMSASAVTLVKRTEKSHAETVLLSGL